MAWKSINGRTQPDGKPFAKPADSFERVFNERLDANPRTATDPDVVFDPINGWPLSTRNYQAQPASSKLLRRQLDQFFDPQYQSRCVEAGNTPQELDMLAKRLLAHAVMLDCPVTDREKVVATRLGVNLGALPRKTEMLPGGTVY